MTFTFAVSSSPGSVVAGRRYWRCFDSMRTRSNLIFWRQYCGAFKCVHSGVRIPEFEKLLELPEPQCLHLQYGNDHVIIHHNIMCLPTGTRYMLAITLF